MSGLKIAIGVLGEKVSMHIDSERCTIGELNAGISCLAVATTDLVNQLKQGMKKQK